ncbi:MAG: leucyl aminopeptidase family protein [Desulfurococcales archaeon]|nr:leucyl aminopeptidase family protein [Desulfurococcales archaeon]
MLYTKPPSISVEREDPLSLDYEHIAVLVWQEGDGRPLLRGAAKRLDEKTGESLSNAIKAGGFSASPGESYTVYYNAKRIDFIGLGRLDLSLSERLENARRAGARAVKNSVERYRGSLIVADQLGELEAMEAVMAGLSMAYRLEAFKKARKRRLERIGVVPGARLDVDYIVAVSEGLYLARDIANAPPNELPPRTLGEKLKKLFQGLKGVEVEVIEYEDLLARGFGGIVSVGKGSEEKPVLIIIRYKGSGGKPKALVGKTVVFDTGGINLKPSQGMTYMRADKAGGAAVAGTLWALARMGAKIDVVGLLPAVINAPSGSAYLPSDVIRMWDGTPVEITNTDAEGRLIVADAIAFAAKELEASEIIELSTLTGAIVVALGPLISGLFTRDTRIKERILEASRLTGEKVWPMPMEDAYKVYLTKSASLGEIANSGTRYGGAIYGALFLERFSHGRPFAHLDIAGPGMAYEVGAAQPEHWPVGLAPGYGVRLLVEYFTEKAKTLSREGAR